MGNLDSPFRPRARQHREHAIGARDTGMERKKKSLFRAVRHPMTLAIRSQGPDLQRQPPNADALSRSVNGQPHGAAAQDSIAEAWVMVYGGGFSHGP